MYKITLYDNNCTLICDFVTFWLVDDLEQFEKNWVPLQSKYNIHTIERYYRSKLGEIVTDCESNKPELNIVQKIDYDILQEKEFDYIDKEVIVKNAYEHETKLLFNSLKIKLRVQRCNDKYYLLGQYSGYGGVRVQNLYNRWYDKEVQYSQMNFFGNIVANYVKRNVDWDCIGKDDAYKDFYTNNRDFYKNESVETFVWLPIKEVDKDFIIKEPTMDDLSILLVDIVGEAG